MKNKNVFYLKSMSLSWECEAQPLNKMTFIRLSLMQEDDGVTSPSLNDSKETGWLTELCRWLKSPSSFERLLPSQALEGGNPVDHPDPPPPKATNEGASPEVCSVLGIHD